MSTWLSKYGELEMTVRPAQRRYIPLGDGTNDIVMDPGLRFKFHPLVKGMHIRGAFPNGKARGMLETKTMAEQLGIPEAELIKFLQNSKQARDGNIVEMAADGAPAEQRAWFEETDKGLYCVACERHLDARGRVGHERSEAHRSAVSVYSETQLKTAVA